MTTAPGTPENAPAAQQSVLSDDDKLRLYRAFVNVPYTGGNILRPSFTNRLPIQTVDDVVEALRALSDCLTVVAAENESRESELRNLKNTIRSGRDLIRLLVGDDDKS